MRSVLESASILVFAAHLLAVNLAMAGPILCVWLEWRARGAAAAERGVERALATGSLIALVAGAALGAGLLGLTWLAGERPYFAALAMIPRDRLAFAAGQLIFYCVAMIAYRALRRSRPDRRWLPRLLALSAAANLMAHFPTLFAMMSVLSHRPETWSRSLDRALYHSLLMDPEVASRVVHVILAAMATAGIVVMLLADRLSKPGQSRSPGPPDEPGKSGESSPFDERSRLDERGAPDAPGEALIVGGARWAFAATLAQLPVGLWALMAMPAGGQAAWAGDLAGLALLGAGVIAALMLVERLAGAALGDAPPRIARRSALTLILTVLLMCGASRRLRQAAQTPLAAPDDGRVAASAENAENAPTRASFLAPPAGPCATGQRLSIQRWGVTLI